MLDKSILKQKYKYYLLKLAPKGFFISLELINNLKYKLKSSSMDKTVFKEVWLKNIYNKNGVFIEEGDLVIDIGAHIGIFSTYASELSKYGKVYAFEPFKENFKRLKMHKELNHNENLNIYNYGVGGENGERTFYLHNKNTGGHSLHTNKNSKNKIEIKTIRLSDFCEKENIENIDFLKVDCEGAEFEILKSDEKLLSKVKKIVLECHPFENNNASYIINLLNRYNFDVIKESEDKAEDELQMIYAIKKSS
ncbi:MAG: FkbM family methyltransferase [Flavobacteriaceae bacterium]|nr:FkbM family methyltransferase [Flavobacteriaceae bacterium]